MSLLEVTLKIYQQSLVTVKALVDGSLFVQAVGPMKFRIRSTNKKGASVNTLLHGCLLSAWSLPGSGKNVLEAV